MIQLKNNKLSVDINPIGAELKKVYHFESELDYLWNGDAAFWGRTAPVLFPIVGRVANDTYLNNGKLYPLSQHGFARDYKFDVISQTNEEVWFELNDNEETLKKFPYKFSLKIGYELKGDKVIVKWQVENPNEGTLPFSIGAHPAFRTNLQEGEELSDYYLHLETNEGITTYAFDNEKGLIKDEKVEIIEKLKLLPLSKELFEEFPTLILENETGITLKSYMHDHEVHVAFDGFPYVGIWSPINTQGEVAPFVCIEPWYGMADTVEEPQEISTKKGIQCLNAGEVFTTEYSMTFK